MRARRIHYGWVIAAVTFFVLLAAAGFRSTVGVFVVPLQDEFGWGRDDVSLAIVVNLVVYGLAAPFAAAFVERMGARRVMVAGLIAVAGGAALTIAMTSLWQLDILWGIVIGTATGAISIPLSAIVATRWFVRRLGLVTGLLAASFATGNLVFLALLAWITDGHGWRWAVAIVAITATAIVPVVLVLMREHPRTWGSHPTRRGPTPRSPRRRAPPVVCSRHRSGSCARRSTSATSGFSPARSSSADGRRTARCSHTSFRRRTATASRR